MGDLTKLAKAKRELEELYSGIPDDSVNLTFQDLAEVRQQNGRPSIDKKNTPTLDPIIEASPRKEEVAPLNKMPSLDFSRGLEASARSDHQIHYQSHHLPHMHHLSKSRDAYNSPMNTNHLHKSGVDDHQAANGHRSHHYVPGQTPPPPHHHHHPASPYNHTPHGMHNNMGYDDMSQMSGISMASMSGYPEKGGRRRPGIPHSNICTICSTYIYVFRHRCLVCGRVYCRQCLVIGMGEMTEGRKCIECLGRRFSQRYIQRAGQIGCCMGYPSLVKQQELKWAEKGPRGSGENRYGRSGMASRSRSPAPRTPDRGHSNHLHAGNNNNKNNNNNPPSFVSNAQSSFVMGSPYSPYYSPTNHPLPF